MIELAPSEHKQFLKNAKRYNAEFVRSDYKVFYASNNKVDSFTFKFEKEQFLHLQGLEPNENVKRFGSLLRQPLSQVLFDLILIKRYKLSDFDYKDQKCQFKEKIKSLPIALSFIKSGGLVALPTDSVNKSLKVDVLIGTENAMLGFFQKKGGYYPRTTMMTDIHRKMNPHFKLPILAIQRIKRSQNINLTYVNKNISETEALNLYEALGIDDSINLNNESHRLLISRAKGTEFLFDLRNKQSLRN